MHVLILATILFHLLRLFHSLSQPILRVIRLFYLRLHRTLPVPRPVNGQVLTTVVGRLSPPAASRRR